jgi:Ca-activated chloride channel homolog
LRWADPDRLHLLWLLPVLFALLIWAARRRVRLEAALGDSSSLRELTGEAGRGSRMVRAACLLGSAALAALALARPQAGFHLVTTVSSGADVVIALDLSHSMEARDAHPDRLNAARREIAALVDELEGSSIGLVGFAGEARVISPLSNDRGGLLSLIETSGPGDLDRPGTDVGAALSLSARFLRRPGERPRAVVLVSDGEALQGDARAGALLVRRAGARLFVLGIGTDQGTTIPIIDSTGAIVGNRRDPQGVPVLTRVDEPLLRDLARRGGGKYERGDGSGRAALRVADAVRSGAGREVRGRSVRAYDERYPWFAAIAGLLLLAERSVPRRRRL